MILGLRSGPALTGAAAGIGRHAATVAARILRRGKAFVGDTSGGAMLVAGAFLILGIFAVGGELANLAWRETHREELLAATRAALTTVGASHLAQAGDGGEVDAAIAAHVERFVEGSVDADVTNVTVGHQAGRIGVGFDAAFNDYSDLWPTDLLSGSGGDFEEEVAVRFQSTRHEFAVALDMSASMSSRFPNTNPDPNYTRMDALKDAMGHVATNLETAQRDSPAGMMVAVVPFSSAVRIADVSGATETAQKKRYLRMMGGRTKAKWVDMFHHYGVGGTTEIALPAGWDWNEDVFSGCFMARWGAYWDTLARPTPLAWPAEDADDVPLHLSDAAPVSTDANTLFYPYSWPNAASAGTIDVRLQFAMGRTLGGRSVTVPNWVADNNWSKTPGGGDMGCPGYPALPLTDTVADVRTYVNSLAVQAVPVGGVGTYTHLGVVWGLRALSPDWQTVWDVTDSQSVARPLRRAAGADVKKSLLIISDGANDPGSIVTGSLGFATATHNPFFLGTPGCPGQRQINHRQWYTSSGYLDAAGETSDADFNAEFGSSWRVLFAWALGVRWLVPSTMTPAEVFRAKSAAFGDLLVANGEPRPTQVGRNLCHYTSKFGPYGRVGDPLFVDGTPRFGHAPLDGGQALPDPYDGEEKSDVFDRAQTQLDDWMLAACQLAANRGVKVHAVFISDNTTSNADHLANLRRCTNASGGEMIVTVTPAALNSTLARLVRIKRQLRFVD